MAEEKEEREAKDPTPAHAAHPAASASESSDEGDAKPSAKTPANVTIPERPEPPAWQVAWGVYLACLLVFAIFAAERLRAHSPDNHFAYLADSYLHGTLEVRCTPETLTARTCPPGGGGNDWANYNNKWFVAFPSFPAVVYMPAVAIFGRDFANRRLDVAVAALAPALLYLLLARLSREKKSDRTWKENVLFAFLHGFGTVFFFTAIQGSVWFVAHAINASLAIGYLWFALELRNPLLAGAMLGLAIHTRANMVWCAPFFLIEMLRVHRKTPGHAPASIKAWVTEADWAKVVRTGVLFSIPIVIALVISATLNKARFGDASEVGYRYLQIAWRSRIERWGLFNYHYLARNLGIAFASLPWMSRDFPYIVISLHGLALWVTTPHYLELARLRTRGTHGYTPFLALTAVTSALILFLYQNSGWVQFGFRFSNDFAPFLLVLLALNGKKIGRLWIGAFVVAVLVNAFGAWTFDRQIPLRGRTVTFYDNDYSQQRYFQPD